MNKTHKHNQTDPTIYHLHDNGSTKLIKQFLRCKICGFSTTRIIKQLNEELAKFDIKSSECSSKQNEVEEVNTYYAENNFLTSTAAELEDLTKLDLKEDSDINQQQDLEELETNEEQIDEQHLCCAPNIAHHHQLNQECNYPICGDLCYLDGIIQQYKNDCGDKYSCLNNKYYPNHLLYFVQATNLIDPDECEHVHAFRELVYKHAVYMNTNYPNYPHQIPNTHAQKWYPILDHLARLYGCACESEFDTCCSVDDQEKACVHWSQKDDLKEQTQNSIKALKELIKEHKQELEDLKPKLKNAYKSYPSWFRAETK